MTRRWLEGSPWRFGAAGTLGIVASVVAAGVAGGVKLVTLGSYPLASRVSAGALFGIVVTLLLAWLVSRLDARAGVVACLTTLGWLPPLFFLIALTSEPLVTPTADHHLNEGPGYAMIGSPIVIAPCLLVAALVARLARTPRLDRLLWATAMGSLLLVACATALALFWSGRPDADAYVPSLPVVQTLKPGDSLSLHDGTKVHLAHDPERPSLPSLPPPNECRLVGIESRDLGPCGPLAMRYDAKADVWIAEAHEVYYDWHPPGATGRSYPWAFRGSDKISRDILVRDVSMSIGPPIGWTLGALVGLVLEVFFLLRARALWMQSAVLRGVQGTLQADGCVAVPGQPPVEVPAGKTFAPGPAWVRLRPNDSPSYRETATDTVEAWGCGTLAEARAALTSRAMAQVALSLVAGLLCAAPLLLTGLGGAR
jgi:hypothetical protein